MSDLISRSELLKAMDTWDKFGYDEHNRLIKIDRTNEEYVPYVHYEDMVKCVNDMPTAYDIDKDDVSDDVCEWKMTDTKKMMPYKTSCGNEDLYDNSYKYCPYCGKKILCKE